VIPIVVVTGAVFFYARPIANYNDTRADLDARQASVVTLRAEKQKLEAQRARTTSPDALARQARRIGFVRPGEQLFIIKGVPGWRRAHATSLP
jgi:cell division protein FtsB